ncbi:MAG: sulfotransferase [Deltaproteobacteria bacterium]|nr:sulfotransferase [Deltaproteobacteria bacterium]
MLRALADEAELHPFGRLHARRLVLRCLVNRLRLAADWQRRPEVLREEIRAPLFVLGLPRSGTTLMLNLLASDPAHRWLGFWEAHDPSPPPASGLGDPRRRRARAELRVLDYLAPDLLALHEMSADGPEECFPLLANAFAGVAFSWMFDVPTFDDWLSRNDAAPAYAYYRRQLQLLQWYRPANRWVLKSPTHLWTVDALLASFPDARIVQLHRDPLQVVPSACSLGATMRGLATAHVDLRRLGRRTTEALADGVERCMNARRGRGAERWIDLHYLDLVRDPLATVRAIYERFALALTPAAEARMTACLARSPQHKRGVHHYTLAQFGLSHDEERRRYAGYCDRHRVRAES